MQRILLPILGPLLCLVVTIGLLLMGKTAIMGQESAVSPDIVLETPDMADVPDLGETASAADVGETPEIAGANDSVEDDGRPDEATSKTTPAGNAGPQSTLPATVARPGTVTGTPLDAPAAGVALEETVLRHPIALSAGLVAFDGRVVQIEGLRPQSAERTCAATTGTWPCGTVARTAFRNFIRARAFTCQTPTGGWTGTIAARCRIGKDDPALWLARNGWAEAETTDAELLAAIDTARRTSKGFYRASSATPEPTPPALQTETGTP